MAEIKLIMPQMGESVMEATVLKWLKKTGDNIAQDESILEVATDKVDTEIPSLCAGVLKEIFVNEGEVVQIGNPIALITSTEEIKNKNSTPPSTKIAPPPIPVKPQHKVSISPPSNGSGQRSRFYSPLVKTIAKQENISLTELASLTGTGKEGRVTKQDILTYVSNKTTVPTTITSPPLSLPSSGNDEIIQMDRMRKMIAKRMVESKRISAHVTSFVEADVTKMVAWRMRVKDSFMQREREPLTFTPLFVDAVIHAIKEFPMINVQIKGDTIIKKKAINIGIAVALPSNNLIVPVLKQADQYNLVGLAKKINELATKARSNKLSPDDLSDGTFTVSNVGSFGNLMGTPIIMQPQVAILALGAIQKKPSVIETPQGDFIGIRHKMFLSHSYDHRVVDGALGGMFVRKVADYLENFNTQQHV